MQPNNTARTPAVRDRSGGDEYPKRPSHFAHRFCRLITKLAIANEIGADTCWMLTVIAHQEDSKRYVGPVTFWNGQLAPLCGFKSEKVLARARKAAVDSGWLAYTPGGKGRPGIYWCLIPQAYDDVPDGATDESSDEPLVDGQEDSQSNWPVQKGSETGVNRASIGKETGVNRASIGQTSVPIPNPKPKSATRRSSQRGSDEPEKPPRWPPSFSRGEFKSFERGLARFEQALAAGAVQRRDRLRFLTCWASVAQTDRDGKLRASAGGLFLSMIPPNEWGGSDESEGVAQAFLVEHDRLARAGPVSPEIAAVSKAFTPPPLTDSEQLLIDDHE